MVNRTVLLLAASMLMVSGGGIAFAGHPDTGPGCGLGNMIWENYPKPQNIGPQVLMATTNGTGFNTFAISSGTSGCTNDGVIFSSEKVNVFVALNHGNISQNMAQGQGEHLASLATLMGIPQEQHSSFFKMTQEKYATFIQSGENSPKAVVKAIHDAMADQPMLAQATPSN